MNDGYRDDLEALRHQRDGLRDRNAELEASFRERQVNTPPNPAVAVVFLVLLCMFAPLFSGCTGVCIGLFVPKVDCKHGLQ
jgi:hypothetical protein